ncbi:uncharacterized protein LOC118479506 [Helianthus annuus]|uniref:uncharacterized protein LOC118479506 n=1 Tax=Helianthus annuus TaxID=4232 RepID=UPI001652D769|nr:uncharacterized protein LOC118479506 [Helianthus annuus]
MAADKCGEVSFIQTTWSTLFKVHCQAFEVLDHLSPPATAAPPSSDADKTVVAAAKALLARLDAIVLQWTYATISQPLLRVILQPGQSAYSAWTAVKNEFNDNKDNFSSMAKYCQHAKDLATQLESVGAPVDDRMLVINILTGLTDQYDGISTVLQNRDPLPDFNEVRSRLNMEESKKKRQASRAAQQSATALAATASSSNQNSGSQPYFSTSKRDHGRQRGRGRGRSSNGRGRGYNTSSQSPAHPYIVFPSNWTAAQWAGLLNNSP